MPFNRRQQHPGLVSLLLLALAWGALDDIATDNATTFAFEYTFLLAISVWFLFLSYRLWRDQRRLLGAGAGLIILAAAWSVASLPPRGIPIPPLLRNTVLFAFAWNLWLAAWLEWAAWKGRIFTSAPDHPQAPPVQ